MKNRKVLYIEDDANQRSEMEEKLRSKGYLIRTSPSGEIGIKNAKSYHPDVILCDFNLPDINGLEVLYRLKKRNIEIPVIILTAHGSIPLAVKAIKEGAYDFIIKPYQIDEIETTIEQAIENRRVIKSDGIARDVSKRNQLEEELKEYSEGLEQKTKELERQTYLLGHANIDLLSTQEKLEEKNNQMEALLKELQKSRDELQIIIDANPDVIIMVDNDGNVVTTNKRINDFFGIQSNEIINKPFTEFLEKIKGCFENFNQFLKVSEELHITKDQIFKGEYDPVEIFKKGVKQIKPIERIVLPICIPVQDKSNDETGKIWVYNDITMIKRANEQLRTIVNASPIPLIVSKISDGKILFVNEHLANLFGYEVKQLMNQKTPDFYYNPDDRDVIVDKLNKEGFVRNHEILIKKPDGTPVWVILSVELTKIGDDLVAISGLYDINERKQAEDALRKERNFISAVLDTESALVLVLDPRGRFVRFNRTCEQVTDYTFAEVKGKHFWDIFLIPEEMERIKGVFDELCAGYFPNQAENYWKTKDGNLRLIAWSNTALLDDRGNVEYIISTGLDITEHREMEDALQKSERNYRELVENSNSIILRWDRNGNITFFNDFAEKFFGYSQKEILGKNVVGTIVPEMASDGIDLRALMEDIEKNPEKYSSNENENMKRNGERVWITWANKPTFDDKGNIKEILSIGKDITDRKKAVEELKRAHKIYRAAIENVEGVPYLKNFVENKYDFIGEGIKNLLGISANDFTPERMRELPVETYITDPEANFFDPVEYGKAFARGEVDHYRVDLKLNPQNGEEKWVSDCSVPIRDEKTGQITGSLGILQDITDRKRAEDRLRLYRKIFINSNDVIAIYDPEGILIEQNPAHRKYYEYSDEEIRGKNANFLMGESMAVDISKDLMKTGRFRDEITTFTRSGDPVNLDLSIFSIINESGEVICYAGIGRDITERKKAEEIMATRLRYEEGLAACSQALLTDIDTKDALTTAMKYLLNASNTSRVYIFENFDDEKDGLCMRQTHEVCSYGVKSEIDNPILQHVPYKSGFERWRNTLHNGKLIAGLVDSFPPSEREILEAQDILSILVIPLWVEGKWYGFIGFDDVKVKREWKDDDIRLLQTASKMIGIYLERKKVIEDLEKTNKHLIETQAQLVQSEKMASLGALVAGIAHEINTPVGAISSMHNTLMRAVDKLKNILDIDLKKDCKENKQLINTFNLIEEANRVINSGTDRVTNIVKRLRSFARLDEAELKNADINEGLEDTFTLIYHEIKQNINVIKNYGDIPKIACYPGQLNQVFLNILINAKQAIRDKGTISITTYEMDNYVHIEIKDNGVGIPEENIKKIFDPGFTTKGVGVGTGLGLSICFKIIQAHRGDILVESEVGKGSTFTVVVPKNLDEILEHT
jgi:PAS domain S-box-containing protein